MDQIAREWVRNFLNIVFQGSTVRLSSSHDFNICDLLPYRSERILLRGSGSQRAAKYILSREFLEKRKRCDQRFGQTRVGGPTAIRRATPLGFSSRTGLLY